MVGALGGNVVAASATAFALGIEEGAIAALAGMVGEDGDGAAATDADVVASGAASISIRSFVNDGGSRVNAAIAAPPTPRITTPRATAPTVRREDRAIPGVSVAS